MKRARSILAAAGIVWFAGADIARAQIELRVSVKFVLDAAGVRPGERDVSDPACASLDGSAISCESEVQEKFEYANAVLNRLGRGYQFRIIEIIDVAGLEEFFDGPDEPGEDFFDIRQQMEDRITASPVTKALYLWRDDALNIYILNADAGGVSNTRLPGSPPPLTIINQNRGGAIVRPLHEMGHALGLCHTHGDCPSAVCNGPDASGDCVSLGDDCFGDTRPDNPGCDDEDELAQRYFGQPYAGLSCSQQEEVIDVIYNVMSYHMDDGRSRECSADDIPVDCGVQPLPQICRHRLTPDQLDRIADRANAFRPQIASGCTRFVDADADPADLTGVPACGRPDWPPLDGSSVRPYVRLADAVQVAGPDDIVLLRGGAYRETPTLDTPLTLRASRGGARIGIAP